MNSFFFSKSELNFNDGDASAEATNKELRQRRNHYNFVGDWLLFLMRNYGGANVLKPQVANSVSPVMPLQMVH